MNKIFMVIVAAASSILFSEAADAFTVYACTNGVYTITTVEMAPTEDGHKTVSSTTTVPGPCSGEWTYVEALAIRPGEGVTFEDTGPLGAGPVRVLTAKSSVVMAVQSGWRRMASRAAPKARERILSMDEAQKVRAGYDATPQLRIGIPLRLLAR